MNKGFTGPMNEMYAAGADTVFLQPCLVPVWKRGAPEQCYLRKGRKRMMLNCAALGSSVASAVAPALCYPLFVWPMSRRALDIGARDWYLEVLWPGVIPALLATPFYLGAALVFGVHSVPGLFVTLALGCIAYVTFLYLFAARRADREDFARVIAAARTRAGFGQS